MRFKLYLPPLSKCSILSFLPVEVLTMAFHSTNLLNTSSFDFRKYTHTYRVLSSMNDKKYSAPLKEFSSIFSQRSLWTSSKGSFALLTLVENLFWCCLPWGHASQKKTSLLVASKLKPVRSLSCAIFCKLATPRCPNLLCQMSSLFFAFSATVGCSNLYGLWSSWYKLPTSAGQYLKLYTGI